MSQVTLIKIMVQPKASRDEVVGMHGDYLKIRVKAPATNNLANVALIKLLARHYGVAPRQVKLLHGKQSRYKTIAIEIP